MPVSENVKPRMECSKSGLPKINVFEHIVKGREPEWRDRCNTWAGGEQRKQQLIHKISEVDEEQQHSDDDDHDEHEDDDGEWTGEMSSLTVLTRHTINSLVAEQQSPHSSDSGISVAPADRLVHNHNAHVQQQQQQQRKAAARRNAWGNLSYADLITRAILSSPDGRLTLSQIYEWMVQNVPYFRNKGDNNSSAGWKNSIRHNLSLHSRFMRVQNEGAGKSSWWVLNPDARAAKATRRRAQTAENAAKCLERKRGRVRKKVAEMRAAAALDTAAGAHLDETDAAGLGFRGRSDSTLSNYSPGAGGRGSPSQTSSGTDSPYWALRPSLSLHGSTDPLGSQTRLIADMTGGMKLANSADMSIDETAAATHPLQHRANVEYVGLDGSVGGSGGVYNPAQLVANANTTGMSPLANAALPSTSTQYTPPGLYSSAAAATPFPPLSQIRFTPIKQEPTYEAASPAGLPRTSLNYHAPAGMAPCGAVAHSGRAAWMGGPPLGHLAMMQQQLGGAARPNGRKDSGSLPADIRDIHMDAWPQASPLACDIDAVIRHEISVAGKFDIGGLENI